MRWLCLLRGTGSRARVHKLGHTGLVAPGRVGSSWIRDQTRVSCIGRWILYHWAPGEALNFWSFNNCCQSDQPNSTGPHRDAGWLGIWAEGALGGGGEDVGVSQEEMGPQFWDNTRFYPFHSGRTWRDIRKSQTPGHLQRPRHLWMMNLPETMSHLSACCWISSSWEINRFEGPNLAKAEEAWKPNGGVDLCGKTLSGWVEVAGGEWRGLEGGGELQMLQDYPRRDSLHRYSAYRLADAVRTPSTKETWTSQATNSLCPSALPLPPAVGQPGSGWPGGEPAERDTFLGQPPLSQLLCVHVYWGEGDTESGSSHLLWQIAPDEW